MKRNRGFRALVGALVVSALSACGGGGSSSAVPGSISTLPQSHTNATLRVTIPAKTAAAAKRRAPAYISASTQSLSAVFAPPGGGATQTFGVGLTTATNPNCVASVQAAVVCSITFDLAQTGAYTVSFVTYDGPLVNGTPTGNPLSAAQSFPFAVASATNNLIPVTLQGIPTSIAVFVPGSTTQSSGAATTYSIAASFATQSVTLYGVDADGNVILGPGAPTIALTSNSPNLTIVAPSSNTPNAYTLVDKGVATNSTATLTASVAGGSSSSITATPTLAFTGPACPAIASSTTPNGGVVSTIAGNGTRGIVEGTGTTIGVGTPFGVAVDAYGNTYFDDNSGQFGTTFGTVEMRRVSCLGVSSVVAANYSVVAGITGFARDANGNYYLADTTFNVIRKIATDGSTSVFAGSGTRGYLDGAAASAQFASPTDVQLDAAGNVYVADSFNNAIRVISATTGQVSTLAGGSSTTGAMDGTGSAAQFHFPERLAVVPDGSAIYVADYQNNEIRKVTAAGVVTTIAGKNTNPSDLKDGTGSSADFNGPQGLALDGNGNLYIADYFNDAVRKLVLATGQVTTLAGNGTAGETNGTGAAATFNSPSALAVDAAGHIFVADTNGAAIREIK